VEATTRINIRDSVGLGVSRVRRVVNQKRGRSRRSKRRGKKKNARKAKKSEWQGSRAT